MQQRQQQQQLMKNTTGANQAKENSVQNDSLLFLAILDQLGEPVSVTSTNVSDLMTGFRQSLTGLSEELDGQ